MLKDRIDDHNYFTIQENYLWYKLHQQVSYFAWETALLKLMFPALCRYDEFCLAELKRKYRWKAYARRDEEFLTGFLKLAFYRFAGHSLVLHNLDWSTIYNQHSFTLHAHAQQIGSRTLNIGNSALSFFLPMEI